MKKEARQILVIVAMLILLAFVLNNLIGVSDKTRRAENAQCDEYEVVHNEDPSEIIHVLTCGPGKKLWVPGYTIRRMQ